MQTYSAEDEIRAAVREAYGAVATGQQEGCCGRGTGCCGPTSTAARQLGNSDDDLAAVPEGYPLLALGALAVIVAGGAAVLARRRPARIRR